MMLIVLLAVGAGVVAHAQQKSQIAAENATRWLGYVDAGDYGRSWDMAAPSFQKAITKDDWEKKVAAVRGPLGSVVSRDQAAATYTTEVAGLPDGEYVVIREQTTFEHKKSAVETITLSYERDKWRVSGYFIK
jgi:hypothetical protein